MSFAVVVFAKTPHYSNFKTRLEVDLGAEKTKSFYLHCLKKTKEKSLAFVKSNNLDFYWAIAEPDAINESIWSDQKVLVQSGNCLGEKLFNICNDLKELGYQGYIFMGADCPHFDPAQLEDALQYLNRNQNSIAIGPCYDGGFYFLACGLYLSIDFWKNVRYSTEFTTDDIVKSCGSANINYKFFSKNFDIDNINDFNKYILKYGDYEI